MRTVTARNVVASALLCVWACAKTNDAAPSDSFQPAVGQGGTQATSGGTGGTGGSATPVGGSMPLMTGGSSTGATGGSTGTGAVGGSATGGSAGSGVMPGTGGNGATGGTTAMAGRPATGGASSTGGAPGAGGSSNGGMGLGPSSGGMPAASGGGGSGGTLPFDPKFKPPDMTATAKIVVMYTASNAMTSTSNIQFTLNLVNKTDAAYPMSTVTVRYWMSAEPPPSTMLYYSSSNLSCSGPKFVPNNANSYLEFTFGKTGSLPPSTDQNAQNDGTIQGGVQAGSGVNENFNQANDWSFDGTAAMSKPNGKITVYDGTTLIWGCEPSEVCADTTAMTGEAGMSGQPAP